MELLVLHALYAIESVCLSDEFPLLTVAVCSLRLNAEVTDGNSQKWKFIRQADGFYRIQSMQDQKFISVSGNNTFEGTPLYLTENGEPHYFGVYFDSDKYSYRAS